MNDTLVVGWQLTPAQEPPVLVGNADACSDGMRANAIAAANAPKNTPIAIFFLLVEILGRWTDLVGRSRPSNLIPEYVLERELRFSDIIHCVFMISHSCSESIEAPG